VKIPRSIVQHGSLVLNADALSVLIVLLQLHKSRHLRDSEPLATVKVGHEKLMQMTGYSTNIITRAVKELVKRQLIEVNENRKKRGEFGTNDYIFRRPDNGEPLRAEKDVMYGNRISYFTFPSCVIREVTAHWSLAKLSASELKLYVAVLYLADRSRSNEFQATVAELRPLSDLSATTFQKAMDAIEERGLVLVMGTGKEVTFHVCDPYTGWPLYEPDGADENDPANYYVQGEKGQAKRLNLNTGSPEKIEELIRSSLPRNEVPLVQGNGNLMIRCPFHDDHNPSCSISPRKNGCFHCFGCNKNGSFISLMMRLTNLSKGQAIQQIAAASGAKVEYHQPDSRAVAIYDYCNEDGKLLKQVLRFPDANGRKVFQQRRPGQGGWIRNIDGLPPMLFNMDWLKIADTVCITEGEKDASTVTDLHLSGQAGLIIGMTSGGASSWDAQLARNLRGKRVVLMPDADSAGEKFAAEVIASLEAEGIEFRMVTFEDAGAKDVTEFLAEHTVEELVRRIGADWVRMPDGKQLVDDLQPIDFISSAATQLEEQITI